MMLVPVHNLLSPLHREPRHRWGGRAMPCQAVQLGQPPLQLTELPPMARLQHHLSQRPPTALLAGEFRPLTQFYIRYSNNGLVNLMTPHRTGSLAAMRFSASPLRA